MQKNGLFSLGYNMGDLSHCSGSVCVAKYCNMQSLLLLLLFPVITEAAGQ